LGVYVVNYPLKYFAERIGAEHVSVEFPAPAGEDPAFWKPTAEIIARYQRADLVLLNGASYAKWVATATLPRSRLVDTSRGFGNRLVAGEDVSHSHGATGAHAHGNFAFTTWLDFTQASAQAKAIMEAFARKRPRLKSSFERNFEALQSELMVLDAELQTMASQAPGRPLLASHPVYQYLARRYALNIMSLHWEPDRVPGESEWTRLAAMQREHAAKWMIWEQAPLEASVRRLKSMGIGSVVFSPAANQPAKGDFMTVMRANLANLRRALD
jgi:zinc transport system substrate-binding protein